MEDLKLLTRQEVAKILNVTVPTVINYEEDGIITRIKKVPTPRYSPKEIEKLCEMEIDKFSPLERRRLEKIIEEQKRIIEEQNKVLLKLSNIGVESMQILKEVQAL